MWTKGQYRDELEAELKRRTDCYALTTSSGTTALHIAFETVRRTMSVRRIAIPALTWVSVRWAVESAGFGPLTTQYLDVDKARWYASLKSIGQLGHFRDLAICTMDTFGNACPIKQSDVEGSLIVDAAHSFGTKSLGQRGLIECGSFAASKNIIGGEGGFILTQDQELHNQMRKVRDFAGRMPELSCALALTYLREFEDVIRRGKREIYDYYRAHLNGFQWQQLGDTNHYAIGILVEKRDKWLSSFDINTRSGIRNGVEVKCYYSDPLVRGLPNTDYIAKRIVCLPSWPGVDYKEVVRRLNAVVA